MNKSYEGFISLIFLFSFLNFRITTLLQLGVYHVCKHCIFPMIVDNNNKKFVETISSIVFNLSCLTVSNNINNIFIKAYEKHFHEIRFPSYGNFYINPSRLSESKSRFFCRVLS